ncbi:thiolase family protein [Chloroflexota bacterium]
MAFPSKEVAVVGIYLTEQGKLSHRSTRSLQWEAFQGAMADAGLKPKDIDGILPSVRNDDGWFAQQLDKTLVNVPGGLMGAESLATASAYIGAGLCNSIAIVHGTSGQPLGPTGKPGTTTHQAPRVGEWGFEHWGMIWTTWYAQMAQRHMYEFGTTSEQLAEVAKTFRHHATLNPRSIMGARGDISTADVINSRMISSPLHLLDCSLDNDGGYAIVVTTTERARDLKKKPVYVLGAATATWASSYEEFNDDYWPSPASVTGPKALAMAGVTHDDLDVLGIYDCFTITVARLMEDLGFCKLGEGGPFVASGVLGLDGKFPTNTDGGLLSNSHNRNPGGMHTIEVVRQLRREVEPERQVPNAKIGFCHVQGTAVLGKNGSCVLAID